MILDKIRSPLKNILRYLMSVAKQMLATDHCYFGLVIVVIAATAIKTTNRFFLIQDLFILTFTSFGIFYILNNYIDVQIWKETHRQKERTREASNNK